MYNVLVNEVSQALIKHYETKRLTAYFDGGGVPTIGYGHTAFAGPPMVRPGMTITSDTAEAIFKTDLTLFARQVLKMLAREPTDNQFGAMVALAFNIGANAFSKSSVLRQFNDGDLSAAAAAFGLWDHDNGTVLKGLQRRRWAEAQLFLQDGVLTAKDAETIIADAEKEYP